MQLVIFEFFKRLPKPGIIKNLLPVWLIFLTTNTCPAQGSQPPADKKLKDFYHEISAIYGTDPLLVNGTVYLENLGEIKGHPYFLSEEWLTGTVFIGERMYPGQKMKYNLETDDLILSTGTSDSAFTTIRLNRALVDSFNINGHHFVHYRKFSPSDSIDKFFESIDGRGFTFLRRHSKERSGKYSDASPGGSYNEMATASFIFEDRQLLKINSKKEFCDYFANQKKDIRKYLRANHIKYRKATTPQLQQLISHISEITQPQ